VCIDPDAIRRNSKHGEFTPEKGPVYTIRDIKTYDNCIGIRLKEIINTPRQYRRGFNECSFVTKHFRPLDSKAISIFRKIAQDVTEGRKVEIVG